MEILWISIFGCCYSWTCEGNKSRNTLLGQCLFYNANPIDKWQAQSTLTNHYLAKNSDWCGIHALLPVDGPAKSCITLNGWNHLKKHGIFTWPPFSTGDFAGPSTIKTQQKTCKKGRPRLGWSWIRPGGDSCEAASRSHPRCIATWSWRLANLHLSVVNMA